MSDDLLSTNEPAQRLGISRATLYQWLAESDAGALVIRGQSITIDYHQGGAKGQGRIRMESEEVERLKNLMRVRHASGSHATPQRVCKPILASMH